MERELRRERHRRYDRYKRDPEAKRFYASSAWQRARERVLIRDAGLCQPCLRRNRLTPANTVHHIEPLRDDWDKALDEDNLEAICPTCHNREHPERGRKRRPKRRRAVIEATDPNPELT